MAGTATMDGGADDSNCYRVSGALTILRAATTDRELAAMDDGMTIDLSGVDRMDTVGAWLVYRPAKPGQLFAGAPQNHRSFQQAGLYRDG